MEKVNLFGLTSALGIKHSQMVLSLVLGEKKSSL